MFALWPGDQLNLSIFIKPTFGFAGQPSASEAGHIANTNVVGQAQKSPADIGVQDDKFMFTQTTWTTLTQRLFRQRGNVHRPSAEVEIARSANFSAV
jgi:hypothetical protein